MVGYKSVETRFVWYARRKKFDWKKQIINNPKIFHTYHSTILNTSMTRLPWIRYNRLFRPQFQILEVEERWLHQNYSASSPCFFPTGKVIWINFVFSLAAPSLPVETKSYLPLLSLKKVITNQICRFRLCM